MKEIDASRIAIVSSGDPVKDQEKLQKAALHQSRIDAGYCPNGCGTMTVDDEWNSHCETCKFQLFSHVLNVGKR